MSSMSLLEDLGGLVRRVLFFFAGHGKGVQLWPDGARYEGDWLDDKES